METSKRFKTKSTGEGAEFESPYRDEPVAFSFLTKEAKLTLMRLSLLTMIVAGGVSYFILLGKLDEAQSGSRAIIALAKKQEEASGEILSAVKKQDVKEELKMIRKDLTLIREELTLIKRVRR
jgi:hypothetical protein